MRSTEMTDDPSLFRRYLLGELDESEQEAFETKLMTSDEHFEELLISEEEIVDDYHAGRLDAREQQKYRERFLVTPERLQRHRFGAALREHVSAAAARDATVMPLSGAVRRRFRGLWRLSLAAAAVALLTAGLLSIWRMHRAPVQLQQTAQQPEGSTVAFFLTAGNLRSLPTEQTFTVPPGVAFVELQLGLPSGSSGSSGDFAVAVENARNDAVLAEGTLPARTIEGERVVVARVPSELLTPGDYRVILRSPAAHGEPTIRGRYDFHVTSQ